jgi:hypothetical protein
MGSRPALSDSKTAVDLQLRTMDKIAHTRMSRHKTTMSPLYWPGKTAETKRQNRSLRSRFSSHFPSWMRPSVLLPRRRDVCSTAKRSCSTCSTTSISEFATTRCVMPLSTTSPICPNARMKAPMRRASTACEVRMMALFSLAKQAHNDLMRFVFTQSRSENTRGPLKSWRLSSQRPI